MLTEPSRGCSRSAVRGESDVLALKAESRRGPPTPVRFARFALLLLLCVAALRGQAAGQVNGTATFRERIGMRRDAVFEAFLEDVSRADAPAEVIGRVRLERPGNPPIPFEITYDPARIVASHR